MNELKGYLPWTKSCFVCGEDNRYGLKRRSWIEGGKVSLEYRTRIEDVGYRHIVHGGISMTLLDEVMTWAAIVELRNICVAAEMTTRFRAPLEADVDIRAEGWIEQAGRRLCRTAGRIVDAEGKELLTASAKYMPMPVGGVRLCEKDFVVSPEAIDPKALFG